MFKEKLKAASIHLSISAFIIINFLLLSYFIWYPLSYAKISGLEDILKILIGIDLILGPLLTFIVYKKNKSSLKFDLSVIASLQLVAFIYGVISVYQGHPAYVVYAGDRFTLVATKDVSPKQAVEKEFQISTLWFPKVAYAKMPDDIETRNTLLFRDDIEKHPEYYVSFEKNIKDINKRSLNPDKIFLTDKKKEKLVSFLKDIKLSKEKVSFFPLVGRKKDIIIGLNNKTGEVLGTINIKPWVN